MKKRTVLVLVVMMVMMFFVGTVKAEEIGKCAFVFSTVGMKEGTFELKKNFEYVVVFRKGSDVGLKLIKDEKIPVMILLNDQGGINCMEVTPFGGFVITTVDVKGNAAQSTNIIVEGKLHPFQYYGSGLCVIEEVKMEGKNKNGR